MKRILSTLIVLLLANVVFANKLSYKEFETDGSSDAQTYLKQHPYNGSSSQDDFLSLNSYDTLDNLKDLTGEIIFEKGGRIRPAIAGEEFFEMSDFLYISYSGEEDVEFSIFLDEYDLLNDDEVSYLCLFDEQNKRYEIDLNRLYYYLNDGYDPYDELYSYLSGYENEYTLYTYFDICFSVTIHALGYNDLFKRYWTRIALVPGTDGISISSWITDFSVIIEVDLSGGSSKHFCNLDYVYQDLEEDYWDFYAFAIPRLEQNDTIRVLAASAAGLNYDVYGCIVDTVLIPAREVYDIDISLDGSFAVISCDAYSSDLSVTVDGQLIVDANMLDYENKPIAVNLLRFGDIYGGQYEIEATITDRYRCLTSDTIIELGSLSRNTILELHPIKSSVNINSIVLESAAGMDTIILIVDGNEVELSNGQSYLLKRMSQDYSVTAKVGVAINIYEEERSYYDYVWSKETTIEVPAISSGDVNGDGRINISDLVDLIDYILSGNDSWIQLDKSDIDGDGMIGIGDVSAIVDILLSDD